MIPFHSCLPNKALKVLHVGLVFSSFGGISSKRTTGSILPNWILISSSFNKVVKFCFFKEAKLFNFYWQKGKWCSHKIDMWLASIVSTKSRVILPSLSNCMMRFLSVMHFSKGWLMTLWYRQYFALVSFQLLLGTFIWVVEWHPS